MNLRVGLIGARGHTGSELIGMLQRHPQFELALVSSRERDGQRLSDHETDFEGDLRYSRIGPEHVAEHSMDAWVLALPNGHSPAYAEAIHASSPETLVLDLSADFRFDDDWYYGLPELTRTAYAGQRRISNPGCYATAMQLAIAPMRDVLVGAVQCFGVSGYSGAGTTPSDKNNPELLQDNLMPYALFGHMHEREVTRHCAPVEFMPHVAPHFRGLTLTNNLHLQNVMTLPDVMQRYRDAYHRESLVHVQTDAPWVSRVANRHAAVIGGFSLADDGRRLVVVSVLDNLLKGAATQAMQNLNLAFGFDELAGVDMEARA